MADKLNSVGLQYLINRLKVLFAKQADLETLQAEVDEIISEGGEPNTIETVKVNGTALVPDAQKAVDVTVPTKVSDLTNDGDGTAGSAFATEDYVDENGGKIDSISVNGTAQTIDQDKNVDLAVPDIFVGSFTDKPSAVIADSIDGNNYSNGISVQEDTVQGGYGVLTVTANSGSGPNVIQARRVPYWASMTSYVSSVLPTNVSDLTNDSGYQTASDVSGAISAAVASAYTYKGSVATQSALPSSGNKTGDVYDVQDTGMNYAWNGTAWDALGTTVDLSLYWSKAELVDITTAEIDAMFE